MTSNEPTPNRPLPGPQSGDQSAWYGFGQPQYSGDPQYSGEPQYVSEQAPAYPVYPTASYPAYTPTSYYGSAYAHPYPGPAYANSYPGYPPTPTPKARRSTVRRGLLGAGAVALAAGLVLSGMAIAQSRQNETGSVAAPPGISDGNGNGGSIGGSTGGTGNQGILPGGSGDTTGNGTSASAAVATKAQQVGIVTVVSVLSTQGAESAGTGMILSSNGEILTNNHVINGATSITVTVESTDRTYRADVVGTSPTKDVAVLKLRDASGLATAKLDTSDDVAVGDAITGVGNAGGTGTLRAASGKVTALEQSITASDETGQNPEKLTGLIEINAGIIAGDSGGPLYNADGQIVGMDTAASANAQTSNAYAIPIENATSIADQIESGNQTSVIHIGLPAYIGVYVQPTTTAGGAVVQSVVPGDPAAKAGVTGGSLITGVDNTKVTTPTALKKALSAYDPGQSVTLTWTDGSGQSHSGKTTLIEGPAD